MIITLVVIALIITIIILYRQLNDAKLHIKLANRKIQDLTASKDEFIKLTSHQLLTPLTAIKGYLSMLISGSGGKINTQQKIFLNQTLDATELMVNVVLELLNVSRITSGKFKIDQKPINLADLVDDQVNKLKSMATSKNIKLNYKKPKIYPLVKLDEDKIKMIINNLIRNSIYYSKNKDAEIDIELTSNNEIEFKIIDNGIGVPENDKAHIFNNFYRASNAKILRPDGIGVGLYLTKVTIRKQGGEIIFESSEGKGSTFGFKFNKQIKV